MLQEIAQWIENRTILTIGVDLFVGHLPIQRPGGPVISIPDRYSLILENATSATDEDWPDYEQKPIQILTRAKSYFTARADARAIFNLLHGQAGWRLPVLTSGEAYIANTIAGVAPPAPIENPNDQKTFTFSANYIFRITRL
jgi:hypothetical protein